MNIFESIILGVVEGITEYLPISSTGHLILASSILELSGDAVKTFEVVIQGGAILAVLGLYFQRAIQIVQGLLGKNKAGFRLLLNLIIAFIPAAGVGFLFHKTIKIYLFYPKPVAIALAAGGFLMIASDFYFKKKTNPSIDIDSLNWKQALLIGVLQCFALFPGFSRSMATILGGMFAGMDRKNAAEFSFLLALPTLGMACLYDLYKGGSAMFADIGSLNIIVGLIVSGIVAAASIKFLVAWLTKRGLSPFGWYRLLVAVAILILWKA